MRSSWFHQRDGELSQGALHHLAKPAGHDRSLRVHHDTFSLALYALYKRSHLRLRPTAAIQLAFGPLVPLLLMEHVVGSRVIPGDIRIRGDILLLAVFSFG